MFRINNHPSFHLWREEKLVKHRKVSFYDHDFRTSQWPRRSDTFLRKHLNLPVCFHLQWNSFFWCCTIQNTSYSQAKTYLRTPFLRNSSQWVLGTDVLQSSCSWKFRNIYRKAPVLESFLKKLQELGHFLWI